MSSHLLCILLGHKWETWQYVDAGSSNQERACVRCHRRERRIVLGQQLADAHAAERAWRESVAGSESPLPKINYDFWRGDLSLIRPNPNSLDEEIREVCRLYARKGPGEWSESRNAISMDQFYTLMTFANRSAVFALRETSVDLVRDGLTAIAMIERQRVDFRDILCCLGLLYYAASKVGGDGDEMFRSAAAIAEPAVAELFVTFTEQTPEYRNLRDSWGQEEVETDDGLGFIGWGFSDYNPSIDLKSMIIQISELVASDQYQPNEIEVATDLPDVWLGGKDRSCFRFSVNDSFASCAIRVESGGPNLVS